MKRRLSTIPEMVRGMLALVAIDERGSFSAAARDLGLTASAVSKLVSRMEARLKVRLVHRTTRKVQLTEMGRSFCERGRRVIEELDAGERELQAIDPEPKGTLSVTAPVVLGSARVLPVVLAFQTLYPNVRMIFNATDRVVDLIREQVDVAVRTVPEPPPTMVARKLGEEVRVLCASPAYAKRSGLPQELSDLAQHDCLPCRVHSDPPHWRFRTERGAWKSVAIDGRLHLNDSFMIREATLGGLGIGDLPDYLVEGDLVEGRLVRVLEGFERVVRNIYAVYTPAPFRPSKVRAFVDMLRRSFEQGSAPAC